MTSCHCHQEKKLRLFSVLAVKQLIPGILETGQGENKLQPLVLNQAPPSPVISGFSQEMNLFQKSRKCQVLLFGEGNAPYAQQGREIHQALSPITVQFYENGEKGIHECAKRAASASSPDTGEERGRDCGDKG